jgi:hypothetical protein
VLDKCVDESATDARTADSVEHQVVDADVLVGQQDEIAMEQIRVAAEHEQPQAIL